jgi:hypothetical protein
MSEDCLVENEVENARIVIRILTAIDGNPKRCRARVSNIGDEPIMIRKIRYGSHDTEITTEIFRVEPGEYHVLAEGDNPCDGAFYIMNEQGNEIGFWNPRQELRERIPRRSKRH